MKFFNKKTLNKYGLVAPEGLKITFLLFALLVRALYSILSFFVRFLGACTVACFCFLKIKNKVFTKKTTDSLLLFKSFCKNFFVSLVGLFVLSIKKIVDLIKFVINILLIVVRLVILSIFIHFPILLKIVIESVFKWLISLAVKSFSFSLKRLLLLAIKIKKSPFVLILFASKLLFLSKNIRVFSIFIFKKLYSYLTKLVIFLKVLTEKTAYVINALSLVLLELAKLPVYAAEVVVFVFRDTCLFFKTLSRQKIKLFFVKIYALVFKVYLLLVYELKIIFHKVKSMVFISYLAFSAVLGKKFIQEKEENIFTKLTHIVFTFIILIVGVLAFYTHPSVFLKNSTKWQNSFSFLALGNVASYAYENASILSNTRYYTKNIEVKEGDILGVILRDNNVSTTDIKKIIETLNEVFSVEKIRIGWVLKLQFSSSLRYGGYNKIEKIHIPLDNSYNIVLSRKDSDDSYNTLKEERILSRYYLRKKITVQTSLYEDAVKNGISPAIISEAIKVLSWDIDFQREVSKDNELEVVYSCMFDQYDTQLFCQDLVYLDFSSKSRSVKIYKYLGNYYLQDGTSIRKSLLRTPIDGARLSSNFGVRRHPVIGYTKMHKGIDFAARTGTPIYAAGDGIVVVSGWSDTFGYNVKIKHNSSVETRYAHMVRIDKNARLNRRVRQGQVIGYVGTTGRSTGPHLHYEMIVLGKHVNPLTISLPANDRLKDEVLGEFLNHTNSLNHLRLKMSFGNKISNQEFASFIKPEILEKVEKEEGKEENSKKS